MKRTILVLATAALGLGLGGCSTCEYPGVAVYWTFPDGNGVQRSCAEAGVARIRLVFGSGPEGYEDYRCLDFPDGVMFDRVLAGRYTYDLYGYSAAGTLLYQDLGLTFDVGSCGLTAVDADFVRVGGDMALRSVLTPTNQCTAVSAQSAYTTTFIWYELRDHLGQVVDLIDADHGPTDWTCPQDLSLSGLAYGDYTVSWIMEVEMLVGGGYTTYHATCDAQPFSHDGTGEPIDTVQVPASTGTCL